MGRDLYEILQVSPNAEPEVITAAYHRLAQKYHPDVNPSAAANEQMKAVNAAYDVLHDPQRRATYDSQRGEENAARFSALIVSPTERRAAAPISTAKGISSGGSLKHSKLFVLAGVAGIVLTCGVVSFLAVPKNQTAPQYSPTIDADAVASTSDAHAHETFVASRPTSLITATPTSYLATALAPRILTTSPTQDVTTIAKAAAKATSGSLSPQDSPTPGGITGVATASANVRSGPGTTYPIVASLKSGDTITIFGASTDRKWWKFTKGWVSASLIKLQGDATSVPLIADFAPPPSPTNKLQPTARAVATVASTIQNFVVHATPTYAGIKIGAVCGDGTTSGSTGKGACSHHGGVSSWIYR